VDPWEIAQKNARVARKLAKSPFAYFRGMNRAFVDLVCDRYAHEISLMPYVHAHGDAHVEQYAVAAEGRGLADFDASAVGPLVVDLVRFATSLVLALPNDEPGSRRAIQGFIEGYRRALEDPTTTRPEPAVATRLRARFEPTNVAWLDKIQKLIVPTPPEDQAAYDVSWADFVRQMREKDPRIPASCLTIKVGGKIEMGIGSGMAEKFLVRIEGPTSAPDDDLVMEAKALQPGELGKCMRGVDLDALRVLNGQAQISNAPQRFLAAVTIKGKPFYSHTWLVHYTEISVKDIQSAQELLELAEDVGLQLGRGHAKVSDASRIPEQRRALRISIDALASGLADAAVDLAARVTRAWKTYADERKKRGL
jgi:hypothetical protein